MDSHEDVFAFRRGLLIARKDGRMVIDFGYEAQKPPQEVFDALMRQTGA